RCRPSAARTLSWSGSPPPICSRWPSRSCCCCAARKPARRPPTTARPDVSRTFEDRRMLFAAEHHGYQPDPIGEVQDTHTWEFFETAFGDPVGWHLPAIDLGFYKFQLTKFMVLELIAAVLIIAIYVPLARKIRNGGLPKGRFWNFFEVLLTFIRDE